MLELYWTELLSITLGSAVAGYYLHFGLTKHASRNERELKSAVRRVEESLPLMMKHEIQREIERLEARLIELKARQKELADKP
jgi:hypothetical protein